MLPQGTPHRDLSTRIRTSTFTPLQPKPDRPLHTARAHFVCHHHILSFSSSAHQFPGLRPCHTSLMQEATSTMLVWQDLISRPSNNVLPPELDYSIPTRNAVRNLHGWFPSPFALGYPHDFNILSQFDTNGATGGCQDIYTVYPSQTTDCPSLTLPTKTLEVQGVVDNGPISQYGWIDQVNRPEPQQIFPLLTCILVYGCFPHPQERDSAIHYACRSCSPSSLQDNVK